MTQKEEFEFACIMLLGYCLIIALLSLLFPNEVSMVLQAIFGK